MKEETIRKIVRTRYGRVAKTRRSCCAPSNTACRCLPATSDDLSRRLGYSDADLQAVPDGANLGLGCGNPIALASLKAGEIVLDLGSGAGFDSFLAARKVGATGKVIGVDMTPEMLDRARANAAKGRYANVEFRLGEIENLPVADQSVNVVISNCVINLSPRKQRVFDEAYRVLAPHGRLLVSDIVLLAELPKAVRENAAAYTSCVAGAELKATYLQLIKDAGFQDVQILDEAVFPKAFITSDNTHALINGLGFSSRRLKALAESIVSIKVSATKP